MITLAISILFVFLFYWLFVIKAKPSKNVLIRILIAFAAGYGVLMLGGIAEVYLDGLIITHFPVSDVGKAVVFASSAGVIEEALKVIAALLCLIGLKSSRKTDTILIFGAAGAGMEFFENLGYGEITGGDLPVSVFRSVLIFHIVMLYIDGFCYWNAKNGKKLSFIAGFLFTVILHILYDFGSMCLTTLPQEHPLTGIGMLGSVVMQAVMLVIMIIMLVKLVREVRLQKRAV